MPHDKLTFNNNKTELLMIGIGQQLAKVSCDTINVGSDAIPSFTVARDLGVCFDANLTMSSLIGKPSASAFFVLYNIRHNMKFMSMSSTEKLVQVFITSTVDNCLLYGLLNNQISKLQWVQNECAPLVWSLPKFCYDSRLSKNLHWLPVKQRIHFQIIIINIKILQNVAPSSFLSVPLRVIIFPVLLAIVVFNFLPVDRVKKWPIAVGTVLSHKFKK